MFGRVKLETLFSHATKVEFQSDNCIEQESNLGHRGERQRVLTTVPPTPPAKDKSKVKDMQDMGNSRNGPCMRHAVTVTTTETEPGIQRKIYTEIQTQIP